MQLTAVVSVICDHIDAIHTATNTLLRQVKALDTWITSAEEIRAAAEQKAKEAYEKLDVHAELSRNIQKIVDANERIKNVNNSLNGLHGNLEMWNKQASKVLTNAAQKAQQVHDKLQEDRQPGGGGGQKTELGGHIKKIEDAKTEISSANQTLASEVTALGSWHTAAEEIVSKAQHKCEEIMQRAHKGNGNQTEIEKNANMLKEKATALLGAYSQAYPLVNNLTEKVQNAIGELETGMKQDLENIRNNIVSKMKSHVGEMLKDIKEKVKGIKGEAGKYENSKWTDPGSGLDGIVTGLVNSYASGFSGQWPFEAIVNGWLLKILGMDEHHENKTVEAWLNKYALDRTSQNFLIASFRNAIIKAIKEEFRYKDVQKAGQKVASEMKTASSKIKETVQAVKKGCDEFVSGLDEKLKGTGIKQFAEEILQKTIYIDNRQPVYFVTELALIALRATANQVANELESVFLGEYRMGNNGKCIASELDKVVDVTQKLHTALTQATSQSTLGNKESPAKAVDSRLEAVRKMVEKDALTNIFTGQVKHELQQAVSQLPTAVNQFDTEAQEQIKEAAKTAIERAAGQIEMDGDGKVKLEDNGQMSNFKKSYDAIVKDLPTKLQALADEHIGEDDPPGGQGGGVGQKFKLATGKFEHYEKHVTQPLDSSKTLTGTEQANEGQLPQAIGKIRDEGLAELEKLIGDQPGHINTQTFTGPFNTIEKELEEIKELVDGETTGELFESGSKGLKTFLTELKYALRTGKLVGTKEGLDAIKSAIDNLKTNTYDKRSKEINQAVKAIKTQLGVLRGKLKTENGENDKDVIKRLNHMKEQGLGTQEDWRPNGTKRNGLGKIQSELNTEIVKLPQETKKITEAVNAIGAEIIRIGFRLNSFVTYDDVVDQMTRLAKHLGTYKGKYGRNYTVNLKSIQEVIRLLQAQAFTQKPTTIHEANEAIKTALKAQMNALDEDVMKTLSDLMGKGLGKDASWQGTKGLENNKNNLHTQQSELSTQPTAIGDGVDKITTELEELRKQLQGEDAGEPKERGVMNNLDFMIKEIGKDKCSGLEGIEKAIAELNRDTVPDINKFLGELCAKIASEAGSVDWKLGLFKDHNIDKDLAKIKTQIDTLRIRDLQEAIAMCDKFLTNADYIKWEKVENIERFVDSEIEKAIAELTKQARRDYVESAKDALKHFADKVAEELGELPGEINRDLFVGFKGFMRQMEGERSENINRLRNVQSRMLRALSSAFQNFFAPLHEYLRKEIERVKKERDDEKNPSLPKSEEPYAAEWDAVHSDVNALLNYLCVTQGFDDRLRGLLHNLTDALTQLTPQSFQRPSTPTLDSVSRGLSAFAGEFGGAYISTYSGAECREADADKYAKVLLSMIPMTHEALSNLAEKCGTNWRSYKICKLTGDDRDNGLGNYLTKCGYTVSPTDGLQEGELQNHFSGGAVYELLKSPVAGVTTKILIGVEPTENYINVVDLVGLLHNMLCRYLQVCHLKVHESPRYPCTVRDMLSWLSGLQYTPVADKLPDHCRALLNRKCDDNDAPNRDDAVMAQCINGLPFTIAEACSHANSLLVTIQGHGRGFDLAAYPYSVDFANNTAQLYYPDDPDEVLDMLRGIVCRLCPVLYFLYAQCCRATATTKGWRECHYGRQVPSSHWQCNPLNKQATDASHNCPPTSPLQSFLTDSCPSLLPHKLSVVDNVIECADCPANLPGQQCLTPLGFWDLGLAASVERTGRELAKSLGYLCSDADACLFQLCRTLCLLCPAAPQSLGDVFALFFQMLRMWNHESSRRAYSHHESYLTHLNGDAINSLFPLWPQLHGSYQNDHLTDALKALAGHDHDNSGHNALSSLSAEPPCQSPSGCAPFLQPLALHANHTFPQKHAQLFVSWIVWLAWQLWELLESLLEALSNIDCTAHGCATCLCQPGNHGDKDSCHCPSLVECGGPLPTLYRYGFTYRNAHALLAGSQKIRCSDLNDQLTKALHSDHFTQLFHQIDQLLYTIRLPFLLTLTALWLTALAYILVSLLYRIDVLRLRSHLLTTNASHQLDVKALLSRSRRMLSLYTDVDYFDDDFHS
ncbi:Extracellular matrix-binding ebh [Babesia ovata]|uniref:Extracellular matrix-binding ebh n=1 Tax=Babesia ovata TaxID=189622 RepID=A0A2H6KJW3_9APIC|nr:Extracellular matrix-binding ebh [Babesia ovata]GBE63269.1 Extracellular matrix-binding ebh [Babesia ovata]